jgi:hypothetical protein
VHRRKARQGSCGDARAALIGGRSQLIGISTEFSNHMRGVTKTFGLVATGGTAAGAAGLLKKIGVDVVAACFVIDLPDLGGAKKIKALGVPVRTLMSFEGH